MHDHLLLAVSTTEGTLGLFASGLVLFSNGVTGASFGDLPMGGSSASFFTVAHARRPLRAPLETVLNVGAVLTATSAGSDATITLPSPSGLHFSEEGRSWAGHLGRLAASHTAAELATASLPLLSRLLQRWIVDACPPPLRAAVLVGTDGLALLTVASSSGSGLEAALLPLAAPGGLCAARHPVLMHCSLPAATVSLRVCTELDAAAVVAEATGAGSVGPGNQQQQEGAGPSTPPKARQTGSGVISPGMMTPGESLDISVWSHIAPLLMVMAHAPSPPPYFSSSSLSQPAPVSHHCSCDSRQRVYPAGMVSAALAGGLVAAAAGALTAVAEAHTAAALLPAKTTRPPAATGDALEDRIPLSYAPLLWQAQPPSPPLAWGHVAFPLDPVSHSLTRTSLLLQGIDTALAHAGRV